MDAQKPAEIQESVVLVPDYQMGAFNKTLKRLNAKAEKFGLAPIEVLSTEQRRYGVLRSMERVNDSVDLSGYRLVPMAEIQASNFLAEEHMKSGGSVETHHAMTLRYPQIKLGNWQVIAKKEALGKEQNLVFCVSDDVEDKEIAFGHHCTSINCEHCNTKRARNVSFLMKSLETGEYKEIGSSCVEDFTGIDPGAALFLTKISDFVTIRWEEGMDEWSGNSRPRSITSELFLARVIFLTEKWGFVSASKARDSATPITPTYDVAMYLDTAFREDKVLADEFFGKIDYLKEEAGKIIAWVKDVLPSNDSFAMNLKVIFGAEHGCIAFDSKQMAFAAAAVPMYRRHVLFEAERQREKLESGDIKHVGEIGGKLESIVRVTGKHSFESNFGTTFLISMKDREGNHLLWKTGSPPQFVFDSEGVEFLASFKIKEHGEYRDMPQTRISNLKFKGWAADIEAAPPATETEPAKKAAKKKTACPSV